MRRDLEIAACRGQFSSWGQVLSVTMAGPNVAGVGLKIAHDVDRRGFIVTEIAPDGPGGKSRCVASSFGAYPNHSDREEGNLRPPLQAADDNKAADDRSVLTLGCAG